jgi:hypothetical protein
MQQVGEQKPRPVRLSTSAVVRCNGTIADATAADRSTLDTTPVTGGNISTAPATTLTPLPMAASFCGTATSASAVDATGNGTTSTPAVSTPMVSHSELAFIQVCNMQYGECYM